jgi:predicted phosphodiesterase
MKIWHISDTHTYHNNLKIPNNIDVIVHTGDSTNTYSPAINFYEFVNFVDWYKTIDCKYKIYVAGNHDAFISEMKKDAEKILKNAGIIYLNKSEITINNIKFWGEPITPQFGNWYFMADRAKMYKHWDYIPKDVNVILTHGPAYGILDASINKNKTIDLCGDKTLRRYIETNVWKNLKLICHGHIHQKEYINPPGIFNFNNIQISNAACVEDGKFNKGIVYHGTIINL